MRVVAALPTITVAHQVDQRDDSGVGKPGRVDDPDRERAVLGTVFRSDTEESCKEGLPQGVLAELHLLDESTSDRLLDSRARGVRTGEPNVGQLAGQDAFLEMVKQIPS